MVISGGGNNIFKVCFHLQTFCFEANLFYRMPKNYKGQSGKEYMSRMKKNTIMDRNE